MWLPVNVHTVPHVVGTSAPPGDSRLSLPAGSKLPELDDLGTWSEAEYELGADVAEALGFSLERNVGMAVRVLERHRAVELVSAAGVPVRIGVAVRMTVRWPGKPGSDGASVAAMAARAQAGGDRAAGTVSVVGFAHPDVGELIPGEIDVDIDGYARLVSAVDGIQSRVADNPKSIRLGVIGRFEQDSENPPWNSDVALGSIWALGRLAATVTREQCPALLTTELKSNTGFAEGVLRAYRAVMGELLDGPVTDAHAADAKARLHAVTVGGPLSPPRPVIDRPIP